MQLTLNYVKICIYYFILNIFIKNCGSVRNNVCKTFEDYKTIHNNPKCWFNPDVGATPDEIVKNHGFPFETHEIEAADGYFATLFRIPHNGTKSTRSNQPILLQHGIAVDSASWMTRGLNSAAFILANAGYDVWLGNSRGTRFSSKHRNYSVYDDEYWNFSFQEIGIFELPAVIDYIVAKTNQQIFYIGHSMGTTESFVYASVKSQHATRNVKKIIALAPVATLRNIRSIVSVIYPLRWQVLRYLQSIGIPGWGGNLQNLLDAVHRICSTYPTLVLCFQAAALGGGLNPKEVVLEDLPVFAYNYLQGFSLKCINHYGQIMERNGRFQFYDYGRRKNFMVYGNQEAPDFPIQLIKIPIDFIYGNNDFLSETENVFYFYKQLQTKKSIRQFKNYSHLDFVAGKSMRELLDLVIKLMNKQI